MYNQRAIMYPITLMSRKPLSFPLEVAKFPALFAWDTYRVPKPTKESGELHSFCWLAINPRRVRAFLEL